MATYNTLYKAYFKDLNNFQYELDIEQLNFTGSSSTVLLDTSPTVTYPDIKKGYDWLFSSGIEFSLVSATDRKFINLFTNELQKYRITLYAGGGLCWSGFLDVENYEEDFNILNH